jgi:hypothetical protein
MNNEEKKKKKDGINGGEGGYLNCLMYGKDILTKANISGYLGQLE